MALLSAFFPSNKLVSIESTASDNSTIYLEIDATPSVSHTRTANVTSFPVETGGNISDHVTLNNNVLELNCVVSGNPFEFINTTRQVFDLDQIRNPMSLLEKSKRLLRQLGSVGDLLQRNESRIENAYRYLTELHKNRNPIRLVTDYELYENMVMTNLNINQTVQSGDSLQFTATFEQVNIVSNQLIIASFDKPVAEINNKKSSKLGKQATEIPTEAVKEKSSSIAVKLLGLI